MTRSKSLSPDPQAAEEQHKRVVFSLPRGHGETVLLVEDEEVTRLSLHQMLHYLGYQVLDAGDGQEALRLYEHHRHEVAGIITDLVMPKMGGEELYRTLTVHECPVRFLMLTGYPLHEREQRLLRQGEVEWLQKPLSLSQLAQATHRIVQQRNL